MPATIAFMTPIQLRFPAEWEPQAAILIAWPHANTDWAARLGEVEDTYIKLVCHGHKHLNCITL